MVLYCISVCLCVEGGGWGGAAYERALTSILVHGVWFGLLLADVGEGANDGDAVRQLLLVLVVVALQQRVLDLPAHVLPQRHPRLVLVQDHVCRQGDTGEDTVIELQYYII